MAFILALYFYHMSVRSEVSPLWWNLTSIMTLTYGGEATLRQYIILSSPHMQWEADQTHCMPGCSLPNKLHHNRPVTLPPHPLPLCELQSTGMLLQFPLIAAVWPLMSNNHASLHQHFLPPPSLLTYFSFQGLSALSLCLYFFACFLNPWQPSCIIQVKLPQICTLPNKKVSLVVMYKLQYALTRLIRQTKPNGKRKPWRIDEATKEKS